MRLLLKLDYNTSVLFGKGAPVGQLLGALDGATRVREEGYGAEKKYVPQPGENFEFSIVAEDAVALPDVGEGNVFATALTKTQGELNTKTAEVYTLKQKVKELEARIALVVKPAAKDDIPF